MVMKLPIELINRSLVYMGMKFNFVDRFHLNQVDDFVVGRN